VKKVFETLAAVFKAREKHQTGGGFQPPLADCHSNPPNPALDAEFRAIPVDPRSKL